MPIVRILTAGVIAGILANGTGYLITGRWFHRFQKDTPGTWRVSESWMHYQWAMLVRICACVAIAFLCAAVSAALHPAAGAAILCGVALGAVLWAVTLLPLVLEVALFVNWHPGFVIGLLLDWLLVCVLAGAAASIALRTT